MGEDSAQGSVAAVSVPAKQEQIGVWSLTKTQVSPAGSQSRLSYCTGQSAADTQKKISADLCKTNRYSITAKTFKQLRTSFLTGAVYLSCLIFIITFYILLLAAPLKTGTDYIHHNRHTACTLTQWYYIFQLDFLFFLIQINLHKSFLTYIVCKPYTFLSFYVHIQI